MNFGPLLLGLVPCKCHGMNVDFLIIGGGIAGVSAAARLARLGTVLVLEAEKSLAHHASGRSAALYEPNYGNGAVIGLSQASGEYFHSVEGVLSPRGLMIVAGPDDRSSFESDQKSMNFDEVSFAEAQAIVPILNPETVAFAGMADHAWDVDTDLLLQGFAQQARAHGAQIVTDARVTGIVRDGVGWRVTWKGGEAAAKLIVNAAGAWVDQVAVMAGIAPIGFQPMRRSMARIPAPGGHDVSLWPMIFGPNESWYAKPDAGALIVSPADEDPMDPHDAWADDMVLAEGLARYEQMVTEPVTRLLTNWAGLRTFSPDRVLVIGPDADHPGFFWLAGQGGYGFQTAPAASQLVADLIGGIPSDLGSALVEQLSPDRFQR
jgi:D-arginine dehydrogenase